MFASRLLSCPSVCFHTDMFESLLLCLLHVLIMSECFYTDMFESLLLRLLHVLIMSECLFLY